MTRHYYYLILLIFCVISCSPEDTTPGINIDISDELQVELWEILDESQRMLELRVTTIETLDCENYSISYNLSQPGISTTVSINNILPPHECIPGTAPASNQINLGHFQDGEYPIQVNLKNNEITNLGRLIVKPRYYQLEMETNHGIFIPWNILKTVPENLVWGYLTIEDANSEDQNVILETFNNRIAPWTEVISLSQGEYGYFKIENGIPSAITDQRETITENLFLLEQTGTQTELKDALNDMRIEFGNQVSVNVFLSDGSSL